MNRDTLRNVLFLIILGAILYLSYQIILPFFVPIAWAAVFAILFMPLFRRFDAKIKRPWLSSLLVCLIVLLVIIGPVAYLFTNLIREAADAISTVNDWYKSGEADKFLTLDIPWLNEARRTIESSTGISTANITEFLRELVQKVSGLVIGQTTWLIGNLTKAVSYFFIMLFTMYYFFLDGKTVVDVLKRLTPLTREQTEATFHELREIIYTTMNSGLIVAAVQGLIGGILFWAVGIPSATLWGAVMGFLSIIPIIGAFLVYVPAGIILILIGSMGKGITVLLVGGLIISQIDNFLRPLLMAQRTTMHPLVLFFAVTGGVMTFGLLGIVVGPVVAAILIGLVKIIQLKIGTEESAT